MAQKTEECSTFEMFKYGLGSSAESLMVNTFGGFGMLFYTDAVGLSPKWAGLAVMVSSLWDAVTDPVMGYISDNTRSRFGRRHPYILFGGLLSVLTFLMMWFVPQMVQTSQIAIFWYLLCITLLFRTFFTVFVVPSIALGYEIASEYNSRAKLQGIRIGMDMAANFCGPALAWRIFFNDNAAERATSDPSNYFQMGLVFSIAAAVCVIAMVYLTRKYAKNPQSVVTAYANKMSIIDFFKNIAAIITNKYTKWVFGFAVVIMLGVMLLSMMQMYVFEHFLLLSGIQKTIAHGGTMVGMGLGALLGVKFVRRFDKKMTVCIAEAFAIVCELILAALFLPGLIKPGLTLFGEMEVPLAFIVFTIFHSMYWFAHGVASPIAASMIADIAEVNRIETGEDNMATFAAMYSLARKLAQSFGVFITGWSLAAIGFVAKADGGQTKEVTWRMCAVMFIVAPTVALIAIAIMSRYPITKKFMKELVETHKNQDKSIQDNDNPEVYS